MKAHVFVVDERTFPVHRDRGFCGVKNPMYPPSRWSLYADLMGVREGELVFFYERRRRGRSLWGYHGIYRVTSEPFFDDQDISGVGKFSDHEVYGKCPDCGTSLTNLSGKEEKLREAGLSKCEDHSKYPILPNRLLIEPLEDMHYDDANPIDDNTAYIDRQYIHNAYNDMLWTLLFRKVWGPGRARSLTPILPEEINKLKILFEKESSKTTLPKSKPYPKDTDRRKIEVDIQSNKNEDGSLRLEAVLEAWMMKNIDNSKIIKEAGLGEVIEPGKLEFFGNNVLYGIGGDKVDILCIHNEDPQKGDFDTRYKITVIELKRGRISGKTGKGTVNQIKRYAKWMAQLTAGGNWERNLEKIQPVVIGSGVSEEILEDAQSVIKSTMPPAFFEYQVQDGQMKFARKS